MSDVRPAGVDDALTVGRLLFAFNREYDEPCPPPEEVGPRIVSLADTRAFLVGDPPHGFAVIRFRDSLYEDAPECYLAELYVAPDHRGNGHGRALLETAIAAARDAGATHMDLCTSTGDAAARALYESAGFTNREGGPDGPAMLYYEREL
jgi:GNAT superfamily N-acetyltransferase